MRPIEIKTSRSLACSIVLLTTVGLFTSVSSYSYLREAIRRKSGTVTPWPKSIQFSDDENSFVSINPDKFQIIFDDDAGWCSSISMAADRYQNSLFFDDRKPEKKDDPGEEHRTLIGSLEALHVRFLGSGPANSGLRTKSVNCEHHPHFDMDESYKLVIYTNSNLSTTNLNTNVGNLYTARLSAKTNWGLLRGFETFSQLVFNLGPGFYGIRPVVIDDEPRFKHRGFMLDTARHYISIDNIVKLIDAMSYNKLNVFHWHMVDDQSFPLVSSTFPQLSEKTAFRPGLVYQYENIKYIIMYAAARGIRVLPELDTPGHTYALRYVPDLLTDCYNKKSGLMNGDFGPIDPSSLQSYKSVSKLIHEITKLFPDAMFHAGGDEVEFDCWDSNPDIKKWMQRKNIKPGDYQAVSNYYIQIVYDILTLYNRTTITWQEVFDGGAALPKNAIVHVWKNINEPPKFMKELKRVVDAGYPALLSSCWYLNYIGYGQDWVNFYKCDPTSEPIKPEQAHLVLGGEICMWTEFVDDSNVMSRVWPRASAAAERLWSPAEVNNASSFMGRLEQMRCRLNYRNINAEPVNGPGYC